MKIGDLKTKKIAILGFGKEGKSTLSFLQAIGCEDISVLDKKNVENYVISSEVEKSVGESKNELINNKDICKEQIPPLQSEGQYSENIKFISGPKYLDNLDSYDYIFKSPGVSPYTNNLLKYKSKIWSQTKLFFELYAGKIISITQTKGKSTTATLVFELLKNAGYKVKFVGNIGNPVLDEVDLETNYDFIVYELSSYMLEDLDNHHSFISILGNIYEDHLDWHGGFENYKNAKLHILNNAENLLIGDNLSKDMDFRYSFSTYRHSCEDRNLSNCKKPFLNNYKTFGLENSYYGHKGNIFSINSEKIKQEIKPLIPGEHNLSNICAILGVCDILKIDCQIFEKTINTFPGLPYRLQNIGTYNGITFIDDANATTPEASIAAIKAFGDQVETIFLGGSDRGYNFESLIQTIINSNIKNIVFFPESGIRIFFELSQNEGKSFNHIHTSSMSDAVEFAYKYTSSGKICLLSCASPSYSIWKNFEEKGDLFKKEILRQKKE